MARLWIKRITTTNFPGVPQLFTGRMRPVTLGGRQCPPRRPDPAGPTVTEQHLDLLWDGQVAQVVSALDRLDLQQERWPGFSARTAPDYFRSNQERMRYDLFSAPRATRSAVARSKAPPTPSCIIACAGRDAVGCARMARLICLPALSELHSGRYEYTRLRLAKN